MSYRSERAIRLQDDLDAVHALAVTMRTEEAEVATDDADDADVEDRASDQTSLAALIYHLRNRLRANEEYDLQYVNIAEVNAYIRRAIRLVRTVLHVVIPEAEYLHPPRSTPGIDSQVADLQHLRELYKHAIASRDLKSVTRLAKLLVANEKELFHAQVDAKVLLDKAKYEEITIALVDKLKARPEVAAAWEKLQRDQRRTAMVERMYAAIEARWRSLRCG